jgi:hypothetical protein
MSREESWEQIPAEFENPAEEVPPVETSEKSDGGDNPENKPPETGEEGGMASIEEHAGRLKISKPILAAIMQSEGWAAGKNVTAKVFKAAIDAFLSAPIGGKPEPVKDGEQKPTEGDKS